MKQAARIAILLAVIALLGSVAWVSRRIEQQSTRDEAQPADRNFTAVLGGDRPVPEADIEARLAREIRFDPDVWIVEIEDRAGRNFLDGNVVA